MVRCAAVCLAVAAYAGFSHYCISTGARTAGTALALCPVTVAALVLAWRCTRSAVAVTLTGAWGALLYALWPPLMRHFSMIYLAQESAVYGILGLAFGRSLRAGGMALCTQLAERLHGPLSSREVRYTRRVTAAWAAFFFSVTALSLALFVAEYGVRRRVLPQGRRAGFLATVQVYFSHAHSS